MSASMKTTKAARLLHTSLTCLRRIKITSDGKKLGEIGRKMRIDSIYNSVSLGITGASPLEQKTKHCCCRHRQSCGEPNSLSLSRILRFASRHSQLVGLHSPVAMENRSYPDVIWWARTQVYPDGVVGVLNSALAVPNIRACRNSVVIGDRILSLKGTTWWRIRDPLLLETTVFCSSFASETE